MWWNVKRAAQRQRKPTRVQHLGRKRLGAESLELRAMLSGVVNIVVAGNTLNLFGDGDNNQVEIQQTAAPGTFRISSPDDTLFILNGANPPTFPELTINGIAGNITSSLGDGHDLFRFLGVTPGVQSSVPSNLLIFNSDGDNINEVIDTLINGDFVVSKGAGTSGYSELTIRNSTVIGDTHVDNVGGGFGTTKTVVDNSILQAGGAANQGLWLSNPNGSDVVDVLANSQFGTGSFVGAQPVIFINNRDGASRVTFSGTSQVAGPGTTTVYGAIHIENAANVVGTLNLLTFNSVNVLGFVEVLNGSGDTDTMVINSTLGSQSIVPTGGPLTIQNYDGFDSYFMKDSTDAWGVLINNDAAAAGNSNWGSSTTVENSKLGAFLDPLNDIAFQVLGDNGADVVNIQTSTISAILDLRLFNGNNSVSLLNNPQSVSVFNYVGGTGNDTVTIDNTKIINKVYIRLYGGADRLNIKNVNYSTMWPSTLLGLVDIDAGVGVDTFSGAIPPNNFFDNFEFFVA